MNHLRRGRWESCMMVPEVTENWYPHPLHSHRFCLGSSSTSMSPQRVQATPLGQRSFSRASRQSSSSLNFSIKAMRFIMVQNSSPKKRRKRKLPDDALSRGDRHLMRTLFGDKVMENLTSSPATRRMIPMFPCLQVYNRCLTLSGA